MVDIRISDTSAKGSSAATLPLFTNLRAICARCGSRREIRIHYCPGCARVRGAHFHRLCGCGTEWAEQTSETGCVRRSYVSKV
jgi:hypothetical protein